MNQGKNPAVVRAMYIIIVPVVVLIIILNTGFLQRTLTAARIHGHAYTVARYNYYYFDYYNTFLEENELRLSELGYDPRIAANQQLHESGVTWKEFFLQQAEADMAETAYYCDLAEAAGYVFSEEELAPVREKLAENAAFQAESNISAANYYVAYYGRGMSQAIYTAELTRQVKAQAYEAVLAAETEISPEEIAAYAASHPAPDYSAADLRVITLEALPDRETGEVGPEQLAALTTKLSLLAARYDAGVSFDELRDAFSTDALGDETGAVFGATASDLPETVAAWCLTDQASLEPGDTASLVDAESGTAYFVLLDGFGESGVAREATLVLGTEAVEAAAQAAIEADYAVTRVSPGFRLATA